MGAYYSLRGSMITVVIESVVIPGQFPIYHLGVLVRPNSKKRTLSCRLLDPTNGT
jgi:hypothetical protein